MKLVAIVGPTSVGKSSIALYLARIFCGEIINADSRKVYRYMDIGTAKPSREEREIVPHHLLDVVEPDQDFNLALYQASAFKTIEDIQHRGRLPFLVGGSGLYVWAVLEGWEIPHVPPNAELRSMLMEQAGVHGYQTLYGKLVKIDPDAAGRIDPRNIRRVVRALEVCHSGIPFSKLQTKRGTAVEGLIIGLTTGRTELYGRIDSRVDSMIEQGLVAEVRSLIEKGYGTALPSMSGIGYRQIGMHLEGKLSLLSAIQQIKHETHRFARHQYAWFRLGDRRIEWVQADDEAKEMAARKIYKYLS